SSMVVLLRCARRVTRKRALRGRNPPGIARPTMCPRVHPQDGPRPRRWSGGLFSSPAAHQSPCLRKSRGFGGRAPKASPLSRLAAPRLAPFLLPLHRLAEAVAFAVHLEDGASVRQAIQ